MPDTSEAGIRSLSKPSLQIPKSKPSQERKKVFPFSPGYNRHSKARQLPPELSDVAGTVMLWALPIAVLTSISCLLDFRGRRTRGLPGCGETHLKLPELQCPSLALLIDLLSTTNLHLHRPAAQPPPGVTDAPSC